MPKSSKSVHAALGFTLLEVVVSVTILSVGILGAVAALGLATRSGGAALQQSQAAELAQNQMALATSAGADSLAPTQGDDGDYHWAVTYDVKEKNLVMAMVTVDWNDPQGAETFSLRELFSPGKTTEQN